MRFDDRSEISLGWHTTFRDGMLVRSFSLPSQWRQVMEIHAAAKRQGLLRC